VLRVQAAQCQCQGLGLGLGKAGSPVVHGCKRDPIEGAKNQGRLKEKGGEEARKDQRYK